MGLAILWSGLAAGALLVGMAASYANVFSLRVTGLVMAFGAGALISAVAYQLVLPAIADRSAIQVGVAILAGALTFYVADRAVDNLGGKDRLSFEGCW
jgi:ZIP family zinc transporter